MTLQESAVAKRGEEPHVAEHRFPGSPKEVLAATIRTALVKGQSRTSE